MLALVRARSIMEEFQLMRGQMLKKIDQHIRKTGFDENYIQAICHHLHTIFKALSEETIKSKEDLCNLLTAELFLDNLDKYPTKRFSCQFNENSDWPVSVLPSELFGKSKIPDSARIDCFHECLKVGDILDCRVSSVLTTEYHLRVIHKYGVTKILDDLNITVKMFRNKSHLTCLKKELLRCELVRVAVSEIFDNEENKSVHVTVDEKSLEPTRITEKLGRIPEENLSSYVLDPPDPDRYSSYANYLSSKPQFKNSALLNDVFVGFGVDPKAVYSFYSNYDRKKCPEEGTGQGLLKLSKLKDAEHYVRKYYESENNYSEALNYINLALEICPKDAQMKSTLYYCRGNVYNKLGPQYAKENWLDWVTCNYLDPNHNYVKKSLSDFVFMLANGYYRRKEYKEAVYHVEISLELCKNNKQASDLLEYLKKKHPEAFTNFDGESLDALHKKKQKLVSKLKKYKSK